MNENRTNESIEQQLKRAAYKQQCETTANPTPYGLAGSLGRAETADMPCRPSLQERVSSSLHRAQKESYKANRLGELQYLLEKNPEVARILDLLDLELGSI